VSPIKGGKTVKVNGIELMYIEKGSGEPLVLLHDVDTDLRNWSQQIDELASRYRVIAYSLRYHFPNAATGKESDFTYKKNADDLLGLIQSLNLGKAHAVGHGYGAIVVATAAMQQPQLFRSTVLMEPGFLSLLPQLQADRAKYARNQILSMVRREVLKRQNKESAIRTYVDWEHTSGTWDALTADQKQRYVDNANGMAAYTANAEVAEFNCEDGKKLSVPVLILQGEASPPNDRIISGTLAECVPGAKREVIPQATHWMHRENPAEFNKAVMEFLQSVK
jgi:pimeloyl-ACP methyl ester carboxylesterase